MFLGVPAVFMFGSSVQLSVLTNVNEQDNIMSYIIRVTFLVILACHIPYIFFVVKESTLIMVEEYLRGSISNEIQGKLDKSSPILSDK